MTLRVPRRRLVAIALLALAWQTPCAAAETAEAERELGRTFAFEAGARLPMLSDPELLSLVRRAGARIVAALGPQPFEYRFFVVHSTSLNAFAVPGGYIYLHAGIVARVDNEDELAGVIGHEIAHVNAHHLSRQQEKSRLWSYAEVLGLLASIVQPAVGAAAMGASASAQLQYRREFEQEADYLGARYVAQAGYAPRGMLDFFQRLWQAQRGAGSLLPPYLLTHPLTEERLTSLEAVLRTAQWDGAPRPRASRELRRARLLARVRTEPARDVLPAYQEAVATRPEDAEARFELGWAMLETGSHEAARATLEQARAMGYVGAERELGRALLRLRQPAAARPLLAHAVEADPGDGLAQYEYARVLEELGETEAALAGYRRAVALAPELGDAQWQLGVLAGRGGAAAEGHYRLGKAHLLRGEYRRALGQFEKAAGSLPPGEAKSEVEELLPRLRAHAERG